MVKQNLFVLEQIEENKTPEESISTSERIRREEKLEKDRLLNELTAAT